MSDAGEPNPEFQRDLDGQDVVKEDATDIADELKDDTQDQAEQTTVSSISELKGQWEQYFAKQGHERMRKITDLASKSKFTIALQIPTGKKIKNPIDGTIEHEYAGWKNETYNRDKISKTNWFKIEKLRAQFQAEKDPVKAANLYGKLYECLAWLYLKMKPDDFERSDWEEMKMILDACNHRTIFGLPSRQGTSTNSSMPGGLG